MKSIKNKIVTIKKLSEIISKLKNKKKVVHCHGVFDLVHAGHIKHFQEAKKIANFLIVSITSDKYVNKGSGRPIFTENLRVLFKLKFKMNKNGIARNIL